MGFSRQEYWSGLPFPSPGDLSDPGIQLGSTASQADASLSEPPAKPPNMEPTPWKVLVAQSCPTLCDPVDCNPLDSSVHGILQAGILEWLAGPFSGDLPYSGTEPRSPYHPYLQADSLPSEPQRKPQYETHTTSQWQNSAHVIFVPSADEETEADFQKLAQGHSAGMGGRGVQPRQSGSRGCSGAGTLCCFSPGHTKGPGGKSGGLLKRKLRKEKNFGGR